MEETTAVCGVCLEPQIETPSGMACKNGHAAGEETVLAPIAAQMKKPRGFAALSKEQIQEISRKGGKAAHARGTAHRFSGDEARRAGRLGGKTTAEKKKKKL